MGKHVVGATAVGQYDLLEELLEILDVVVEALDVAAPWIAQKAVGTALAAPVHDGAAQPALLKVAHRLEIFLHAFVAAGQDDDGAPDGARRGGKAGIAQLLAVARRQEAAEAMFGNWVCGSLVKDVRHSALRLVRAPVRSGADKVIEANPEKANPFAQTISGAGNEQGRRPHTCAPPASVDPGGRDVTPGSASSRPVAAPFDRLSGRL